MSDADADDLGITFGVGTCPPEVAQAVHEQVAGARISMPAPSTARVESFFSEIAELIKQAGGRPR